MWLISEHAVSKFYLFGDKLRYEQWPLPELVPESGGNVNRCG